MAIAAGHVEAAERCLVFMISERYVGERVSVLRGILTDCTEKLTNCKDPVEVGKIARLGTTASARLDELAMLIKTAGAGDKQ